MRDEILINNDRFTLYLSEEKIQQRVKELAAQINGK